MDFLIFIKRDIKLKKYLTPKCNIHVSSVSEENLVVPWEKKLTEFFFNSLSDYVWYKEIQIKTILKEYSFWGFFLYRNGSEYDSLSGLIHPREYILTVRKLKTKIKLRPCNQNAVCSAVVNVKSSCCLLLDARPTSPLLDNTGHPAHEHQIQVTKSKKKTKQLLFNYAFYYPPFEKKKILELAWRMCFI